MKDQTRAGVQDWEGVEISDERELALWDGELERGK